MSLLLGLSLVVPNLFIVVLVWLAHHVFDEMFKQNCAGNFDQSGLEFMHNNEIKRVKAQVWGNESLKIYFMIEL